MINKNIIISLVASVIVVGGILLIFKGQAASVTGSNDMFADRGGLTEFQTDSGLPQNTADFTDGGTALQAIGRASYKFAP